MWLVGYPTETEDDFAEYTKLVDRLDNKKHTFVSNIVNVTYINRNSPLLELVDIDWNDPNRWTCDNSTPEVRLQRKRILDDEFARIGKLKYKHKDTYKRALR